MKTLRIINDDGEIVNEIHEGDRITRGKSTVYLKDTIPWGKDMTFVKLFDDYFPKVSLELSGGAVAVMTMLSTYIAYESGMICSRTKDYPLNNHDIERITQLSEKTVSKLMDELVESKVFCRNHVGRSWQYFANPYIFCRGARINKTLEAMFKDYPQRYR
jgi:hypothetical protein